MSNRVEKCDIWISDQRYNTMNNSHQAHIENKRPHEDNYLFIPSHCPEIRAHIKSVFWDCVENTLSIEVYETKDFAAYRWFSTINKRTKDAKNTAFVDIEKDVAALVFLDAEDVEVARFKFKELSLVEHMTSLGVSKWDLHKSHWGDKENKSEGNPVLHEIKIKYKQVQEVPILREEDQTLNTNKRIDNEWQEGKMEEIDIKINDIEIK